MTENYNGNRINSRKIGLVITTSLVIGNMIGSGIFSLPASLARYGGISIVGWLITGTGAMLLAIVFGRLSRMMPRTGGPFVYTKEGYGDFIGFLVAWGYWISVMIGNAAIAVSFSGYMSVFFPALAGSGMGSALVAIGAIWLLTFLNTRGVRSGGQVQLVTTILKIAPLLVISIVGIFYLDPGHFVPFNLSEKSGSGAIASVITLTLWALLGMESATIPAENIKEPRKTIPRAILIGTSATVFIYLVGSISVMGLVSPHLLVNSSAPFADAASILWGDTGRYIVGFGAVMATFGALNGWILIQGQMPMAVANAGMFPPVLGRKSKRDVPVTALVFSSVIVTIVVLLNFSKGLADMFTFLILLSTLTVLIPYLFSSLAEVLILSKNKPENWRKQVLRSLTTGIPAFGFSLWAIYGSGSEIVFYGFLLLMSGIPFYVWAKIHIFLK